MADAASRVRMCLVMDNGLAKSYGNTQHGSNGKEDIAVGEMHMCVILDNDGLKCWGQGQGGQLGAM